MRFWVLTIRGISEHEHLITELVDKTVDAFHTHDSIDTLIFDNTNLNVIHLEKFMSKVTSNIDEVILYDFSPIPFVICLSRNERRVRRVPDNVIHNMHKKMVESIDELRSVVRGKTIKANAKFIHKVVTVDTMGNNVVHEMQG